MSGFVSPPTAKEPAASRLVLASTSRAADGGYLALADVADIAAALDMEYAWLAGTW